MKLYQHYRWSLYNRFWATATIILYFLEINLALENAKFINTHTYESFSSATFIILTVVVFQHKKKSIPVMTVFIFKMA